MHGYTIMKRNVPEFIISEEHQKKTEQKKTIRIYKTQKHAVKWFNLVIFSSRFYATPTQHIKNEKFHCIPYGTGTVENGESGKKTIQFRVSVEQTKPSKSKKFRHTTEQKSPDNNG